MVFPLISVLHTIPRSYEEAAINLGGNRLTVFRKVLFPLSISGITAGVLITFILTMAAYVTPTILGGGTKTVPVLIEESFVATGNWGFASALSMILVVVALLVMFGYYRVITRVDTIGGL
jgi:ABC-type spermidine/putrescine transport system permease subunit I